MSVVPLAAAKRHLGIVDEADDLLVDIKLDAAQRHIESWLGYELEDRFDVIPADIQEAIMSLAASLYENREAVVVGLTVATLPLSVRDVIAARRAYFTGAE